MSQAFSAVAELYDTLESISSTNKMRSVLAAFFKKTPREDVDKVAYLSLGQIAPEFANVNLGMASQMVLKSIARASGKDEGAVKKLFKKKGDVGLVAEACVGRRRKKLTVKEAFQAFHEIAQASGAGSQDRKTSLLAGLLRNASPLEARYLARIVTGTLRLGAGDKIVLDALTLAFTGSLKDKKRVEHAYNTSPDIGAIAKMLATKGAKGIRHMDVSPGTPIQAMLCQRIESLDDVKEKMGYPVAVEEKYDGERIQVHKDGKKITLFSRRLEDVTAQFPDVVDAVRRGVRATSCILDAEVMPVDEKGNLLPFQVLMQRRRKHAVEEYAKKIPAVLFVFDLLFKNGASLLREPYRKRYAALQDAVKETRGLRFAERKTCDTADCIEDFFNTIVQHGGEGVVIKNPNGVFEAGVRGWNWIKWKPEYAKGLRDTFDLVVVGAYRGRGKRAGTYGALLCAAYNKKEDRFETFCKLGSGFTDEQLAQLPKKFKKYETKKPPARVHAARAMVPDAWFSPGVVAEVIGAEITRSPNHTCAGEKGKGLALRFPRFSRWREDKSAKQATTVKEIVQIAKKRKT